MRESESIMNALVRNPYFLSSSHKDPLQMGKGLYQKDAPPINYNSPLIQPSLLLSSFSLGLALKRIPRKPIPCMILTASS